MSQHSGPDDDPTLARFRAPAREYAPMPFWFLNDDLDADKLRRQIADFDAHGVGGFVLHPRVGLPRHLGWMSEDLLGFMRVAIEEAARRGMSIILYDEGMYPSGSSSGQVVAEDPAHQCRALDHVVLQPGAEPVLPADANLVAVPSRITGERIAVFDRKLDAGIRGLHFKDHDAPRNAVAFGQPRFRDPPEDTPPAGDLLNPDAVACFIRLVYDRYYREFGGHFGKTIFAIFTDEPDVLARSSERNRVHPGTAGILPHVNRLLGYDFTPHLPALWYDDEPNAAGRRHAWDRAIRARLEETYYAPLKRWCDAHGLALTGHPADPDDLGMERHFHIPGQDIVWRHIEPGKDSALLGPPSTTAKCASSAMVHLGRERNLNEMFGAYGHDFTYEEMKWLTDWTLVRGQNLLVPHAFYYSLRGPRIDERPPDVGPNSPWWSRYREYADYVARLCALNAQGRQVCHVAVLANASGLPSRMVKPLYESQIDFNYLQDAQLAEAAAADASGIRIRGMHYSMLLVDESVLVSDAVRAGLGVLENAGRVIGWSEAMPDAELIAAVRRLVQPTLIVEPTTPQLRTRHVMWDDSHWFWMTNEALETIRFRARPPIHGADAQLVDPLQMTTRPCEVPLDVALEPYQTLLLRVLVDDSRDPTGRGRLGIPRAVRE